MVEPEFDAEAIVLNDCQEDSRYFTFLEFSVSNCTL